jgi:uncharacterized protein (UPF0332 family)
MVNINWCFKQKGGIKTVEPNDNLAQSYIKMAEDAIGTMNREKEYNMVFAITACYYSIYYSLYAVLRKIGIKCEIHSCSIEFMEDFLLDFYDDEDVKLIRKAFDVRNVSQYYADRVIDKTDSEYVLSRALFFVNKSKEVLSKLNQRDIESIKSKINSVNNKEGKYKKRTEDETE